MKVLALTLAGLCAAGLLSAQICGAPPLAQPELSITYDREAIFDVPETNRRALKKALNGKVSVFLLQFYVVTQLDAPSAEFLREEISKATERMNQHFSLAMVKFEVESEIVHIRDPSLASFMMPDDETRLTSHKRSEKRIHVFLVEYIQGVQSTSFDGYAYNANEQDILPHQADFLVVTISALTDGSTLSHEMGHFFGLQHTHEYFGTDKAELVDRYRCNVLGDGLCDTPADPQLYGWVDPNGKYTGAHRDAEGNGYAPMVNNLMSYAQARFRNEFTPGQARRIEQTALFKRQNLIVKTSSHTGSLAPSVSYLTLAGAYEQFLLGGPDKALVMLHRDSAMWSARMVRELASMIQHNSPYINVIGVQEQYSFVLYDGDEQKESIPDFIGNRIFHQPNEMVIGDYEWLSMILREKMMEYPCLLLVEFFKPDYYYTCRILGYFPGYMKPQEVLKLLLRQIGGTRLLTTVR
jgi:hypothetical protein